MTLLIEQEADAVGRDERQVEERIREMLEARITGRNAIIWKVKSGDIPDKEPAFLVAYMPLNFGTDACSGREAAAKEIFENYGGTPRKYRNGLGLAIPAAEQVEILRRSVRYLLAMEHVREKSKQLNLTDEQKSQLRERERTEIAAAESGLLKLYPEVWLPKVATDGIGAVDVAAVGGRPLQITVNEKKQARVHDRTMELLVDVKRRVFTTVNPGKIVELFKLGEGNPPTLGIKTNDVIDGFYSFPGFPRLVSSSVVQKAIAKGIADGFFGYYSGSVPSLGSDGKYHVPVARVRFNAVVTEDEIDLDSGFLIMPQAVPQAEPLPTPTGSEPTDATAGPSGTGPTPAPASPSGVPAASPSAGVAAQKSIEITFSADRNQLFTAWNAIANLADLAGKVAVTVHADSAEGFDKGKLQNGVLEPLRESDLIE